MKVTFLGTGTSQGVPVIGCDCPICLSLDPKDKRKRCAMLFQMDDGYTIVIDTGPDFREQMLNNQVKRLDAVIYTHDHYDHVCGLGDIRAYNYCQEGSIKMCAEKEVFKSLKDSFHYVFGSNRYAGYPDIEEKVIDENTFLLDSVPIQPIRVMHYKLPVLGFRIGDFTYITDANYITPVEKEKIKGSKVLVLNALRHEKHISHFNVEEALAIAKELNVPQTYFTHISHQLGYHKSVNITLPDDVSLAYDGLQLEMP